MNAIFFKFILENVKFEEGYFENIGLWYVYEIYSFLCFGLDCFDYSGYCFGLY